MPKIFAVVFLLIIGAITIDPCVYGQEVPAGHETYTIQCQIAEVNWVRSTIVVRYYLGIAGDEMHFMVPHTTEIKKGSNTIALSELNVFDRVTVIYYDDGLGGLKTVRITVRR